MAFATPSLSLSLGQVEILAEHNIDHTKLYFVDNDKLSGNVPAINAYSNGHYVIFIASEETANEQDMLQFMQAFYGVGSYKIVTKARNLFIFATPSSRFYQPENLVAVTVSN